MQIHDVQQGSAEWHALRADHFTASEAPAMMGVSPYLSRSELLHQKATRLVDAEVDGHKLALFKAGHDAEAAYRPIAEDQLGDDLYPVTGTLQVAGQPLLASFDGLVMGYAEGFEHKLWSGKVAQHIEQHGEPLMHHVWQLEQQLLVSGGKRILFVTSDGTTEQRAWCWYESKPERRAALIAGWVQFAVELAAYVPPESTPVKVVAEAVTSLPAVLFQASGTIALKDNFPALEVALRDFISNRLILKPETDQDFANLDLQIKALKNFEGALDAGDEQMFAQLPEVDRAKRTKDMLHKLARDNRLMAEKLLATRKDQIRLEVVQDGQKKLTEHIAALNTRLGKPYMPAIASDFAGAVKGKRTVDSLRDAVNTELARAKIAANEIADRLQINLGTLRELASAHAFLFADAPQLVMKANDDLQVLIKSRIGDHQAAELAKEEATRQRIRAEEQEKAEKEAREKVAREQVESDAAQKQQAQAAIVPVAPAAEPAQAPAPVQAVANVVPMRAAPAPAATSTPPSLKLGQIADRLGFTLTADFLKTLGFEPAAVAGASKLYHEASFAHMCAALVRHIEAVQAQAAA